jgi:pyruvate/2-oxoglutarate/acetoin dehydrogenase E1 component
MRAAIACNDPVIFIENIMCYGLQSDDLRAFAGKPTRHGLAHMAPSTNATLSCILPIAILLTHD